MNDLPETPFPALSVVIPCFNAASLIGLQLEALAEQSYLGDFEVIVADNGSTDELADVIALYVDRLPDLSLVDASGTRGVNHARNVGVTAARHETVVVCDADDIVKPGWLAAFGAASRGDDVLGGRLESFVGSPVMAERPVEQVVDEPGTLGFLPYAIGANMGFKRSVWEQIGGFDEEFVGGADEIDFCWRAQLAGHSFRFVPEAAVWYRQRVNRRLSMRQARRRSLGQVRLYKKHRSNGFRRRNPVVGLLRRCSRLIISLPDVFRGGDPLTKWLCRLAALVGHVEGAIRFHTWCP